MNINEKFLLKILAHTDYVFCSKDTEQFYFSPNGLNVEIKIPYSHSSSQVNIHFVYDSDNLDYKHEKRIINFSFDTPDEIKRFMLELFKKYELTLNDSYEKLPNRIIDKFNDILKNSSDVNGVDDKVPYLIYSDKKETYHIDINNAAFSFGKKITFRPLSPIIVPCYYSEGNTEKIYKKVVLAYFAKEYPSLNNFIQIDPVVKNLTEFNTELDLLKLFNPKSASALSALMLDIELNKNTSVKNSRPKL